MTAMRWIWIVLAAAACQDSVTTPFPPGLEPLDDGDMPGQLPLPAGEQIELQAINQSMIRVYGRGRVLASPDVIWRGAQVPEVMVARCKTTRQDITRNNEPEHELSFLVHYLVDDIFTIEWDDQWRGGVVTGTSEAPELAMIKHQKIEGSDFIYVSEGTIQIRKLEDPGQTELWFVEHLDAISGSMDDVVAGQRDIFNRLVAHAHGLGFPPCP
jgi:hypothetical protein